MDKKDRLWEKAKKDFPRDLALQEIHYARLKLHEETKEMTAQEFVKYIKTKAAKVIAEKKEQKVG